VYLLAREAISEAIVNKGKQESAISEAFKKLVSAKAYRKGFMQGANRWAYKVSVWWIFFVYGRL
jgi:hypothetical protein